MAGRKIHDEHEARELLRTAAKRGADRVTWARDRGIDPRSLNAWRVNLERRAARTPAGGRLIELVAEPPAARPAPVQVRCGSFVVEVTDQVDDHLLARVLAVVAAC